MPDPNANINEWSPQRYFELVDRTRETGKDATRELILLEEEYLKSVPRVAVARCPFTGAELVRSVDTRGLDGLWWRYDNPVRPLEEPLPTFFALTGAVKLAEVEVIPFLCKPGPEVPFVIPRLLEQQSISAVISELGIGAHRGFAISYFADPTPEALTRFNDWGTDHYETPDGWASMAEDVEPLDFDLAPWISSTKLAWIAPGDRDLSLRHDLADCPYLGLQGHRSFVRIQAGKVWTPAETSPPRASGEDPFDPR
jgi:hypothetical protein